jgi:methionine aminotransferase
MKTTKFTPIPTHGTYFQIYSYEKISDLHDIEMAEWVTKEYKVATIPTSVFYKNGEDIKYLRFCFAKSTETMEKAAELLCKI